MSCLGKVLYGEVSSSLRVNAMLWVTYNMVGTWVGAILPIFLIP